MLVGKGFFSSSLMKPEINFGKVNFETSSMLSDNVGKSTLGEDFLWDTV